MKDLKARARAILDPYRKPLYWFESIMANLACRGMVNSCWRYDDHHSDQCNPNNDAYWESRGEDERPDDWEEKEEHED